MASHVVILGLGYGDEGKGSIVDWVCATRDIKAVVRYNGGPQAAHNVVLPDGTHHTFSQLGAGTFRGVPTHLSRHVLVNPMNLAREADHLIELGRPDPLEITTISEDALLVTPYHRAANRARERLRGASAHGSCGQGIGETVAYSLACRDSAPRVGDLRRPAVLRKKLQELMDTLSTELPVATEDWPTLALTMSTYALLMHRLHVVPSDHLALLLESGDCVFEGAQGVMLDQDHGFHPHTTWSRCTDANALELLLEAGVSPDNVERVGVTRTYGTRHGNGPFPGEDPLLNLPENHNAHGEFQGAWRQGRLNLSLLDYAIRVNHGVDAIALTHCDAPLVPVEHSLEPITIPRTREGQATLATRLEKIEFEVGYVFSVDELRELIEIVVGVPVTVGSYGPTAYDKTVFTRESVMTP